ncbi:MAG TPA: hypothetical protein VG479_01945 [Gaiellaceae bacterium]|jgi:hypothetical protein|nr:hypothetical protein [Gaiellaceae bacterium]
MTREALVQRFENAGLSARITPLEPTTGELLVSWLTPVLAEHETIEQLQAAGAEWIFGDAAEATRARLKEHGAELGERVCALWPFDAFAVEMALLDFADHFDELWFPASDDVWLLSLRHRRFVILNREELLLYADLGGPARWPALHRPAHP